MHPAIIAVYVIQQIFQNRKEFREYEHIKSKEDREKGKAGENKH